MITCIVIAVLWIVFSTLLVTGLIIASTRARRIRQEWWGEDYYE